MGELGSGNKSRQVSADELTRRLFAPRMMGGVVAQPSRSSKARRRAQIHDGSGNAAFGFAAINGETGDRK